MGISASWTQTVVTRTDKVTPFATLVIPVDTENNLYASGVVLPFSVHILSTSPVRVFTLSHKPLTSDGVTALPVILRDTSYVIAAVHNDPSGYTGRCLGGGNHCNARQHSCSHYRHCEAHAVCADAISDYFKQRAGMATESGYSNYYRRSDGNNCDKFKTYCGFGRRGTRMDIQP